jgi:hypothetical protein
MKVDQNTTFTQIYNQMKPGLLSKEDKHIRGSGNDLYTHNALMPHARAPRRWPYHPSVWLTVAVRRGAGVR